jgi:hypothetical protein
MIFPFNDKNKRQKDSREERQFPFVLLMNCPPLIFILFEIIYANDRRRMNALIRTALSEQLFLIEQPGEKSSDQAKIDNHSVPSLLLADYENSSSKTERCFVIKRQKSIPCYPKVTERSSNGRILRLLAAN